MKVYITKYSLSSGIKIYDNATTEGGYAHIPSYRDGEHQYYPQTFHGNEWHTDESEARKQADTMRLKKIKSLRKQIEKLEKLKF